MLLEGVAPAPDARHQGQLERPDVHAEPRVEDLGALDALELLVEALVVVDLRTGGIEIAIFGQFSGLFFEEAVTNRKGCFSDIIPPVTCLGKVVELSETISLFSTCS